MIHKLRMRYGLCWRGKYPPMRNFLVGFTLATLIAFLSATTIQSLAYAEEHKDDAMKADKVSAMLANVLMGGYIANEEGTVAVGCAKIVEETNTKKANI